MKLTAKQQEIKDKILAGTHVLRNDVGAEKVSEILELIEHNKRTWYGDSRYYRLFDGHVYGTDGEILKGIIINMSEWFKEDFNGNREYDEKLLFNLKVYLQDECYIKPSFIYNFLDKRYPNELLKEKEELEARLKEINEKLNG